MIKPTRGKIVVIPEDAERASPGGIILPDGAQKRAQKGRVIAVGDSAVDYGAVLTMETEVGDIILYGKFVGDEFTIEGIRFLIMGEAGVLAILSRAKPVGRVDTTDAASGGYKQSAPLTAETYDELSNLSKEARAEQGIDPVDWGNEPWLLPAPAKQDEADPEIWNKVPRGV